MSDAPKGQMNLTGIDPLQEREFTIRKRSGRVETFNEERIFLAVEAAFKAEREVAGANPLTEADHLAVRQVTDRVVEQALAFAVQGEQLEIERIQDLVELQLMKGGHLGIARRYIIYREERRLARALRGDKDLSGQPQASVMVTRSNGQQEPLDTQRVRRELMQACRGLEDRCSWREMADEALVTLYDGVRTSEVAQSMVMTAKSRIEREPAYTYVAARLLLNKVYREVLPAESLREYGVDIAAIHTAHFADYVKHGVEVGRLHADLLGFDLPRIAAALRIERDEKFTYMGIQTVYDRYLLHDHGRRIESPQYFWMRVSMGLAMREGDRKDERAIEFYEVLSSFLLTSSTPTLFNAGTLHPQLSSCYLSTVMDDLDHIFKVVADDAKLSKWAGGLGNDWSNIRATGSVIKGTNGTSQGVIPFLKVANDTAVAVNQGGKRKGAMCAYLETWHLDVEDFLELRKNTGDERRRTHDMNTANWIPDLFMKRVASGGTWTLFSPSDVKDLHDLYGAAFEARYTEYEGRADRGEIKLFKRIDAMQLWRKMLTMLFETGHPWITFKDPSNVRSPQDHAGVVHSSNLCTEILLNTSEAETAVCNLASVNLPNHIVDGRFDEELVAKTIKTGMRMLDNVIDINYYPTPEAKASNLKHRPVGLGLMGFQDALYKLRISYASQAAVEFADKSMEVISYYAILASSELAAERGTYESYKGSKWDRGLLPIDTIDLLERERGGEVDVDRSSTMDWAVVRESLKKHGMRNSNTMAIAPTATISNITGVSQSIEPTYKNLYAKSNLSGEFTTVNTYLIEDLRALGIWDSEMLDDLKYFDGSLLEIERVPDAIKEVYRTSFEIDPVWIVEAASRRQKWIDMGQSLNLYIAAPSGKKLNDMYFLSWRKGLKTTYYLRSVAATSVEKSTLDVNRRGLQPRWMKNKSASSNIKVDRAEEAAEVPAATVPQASPMPAVAKVSEDDITAGPGVEAPKACSLDNPDCESCQ
ncbi:ribonucleoside-diphosphate reductase subunit alpha [Verrucomicrobium sp. GAS474]|uniref:ribonucleoside-diphosphate reductase subunit alpha n=1 Tax=Verrucomicrobium sp. GAS474 TaxID=1882831 RepID=UPI000B88003E|nr:ribonucleoside-diphosphate reductase subunit alpha [Verrucomicrobium sp. GAS474]